MYKLIRKKYFNNINCYRDFVHISNGPINLMIKKFDRTLNISVEEKLI